MAQADSVMREPITTRLVRPVTALLLASFLAVPVTGCKRIEEFKRRLEHQSANGSGPGAAAESPGVPVTVATVARRDVDRWSEWVATVDGSMNAAIRPRVNGYLLSRDYEEGAFLRAGDLMFTIDRRPFEAALEGAKADLARSRANQAKTQLDVNRLTPLVERRAVSQQELDDAIGANNANLAQIKADEAAVTQAELDLAFTRIAAPIDGIAGRADAQIGDLVGPVSPVPLTTMSTVDPLKVYFFPTEREYLAAAERLTTGSAVPMAERPEQFELLLADGSTFGSRGRFAFVDRQVEVGTGAIRIGVAFPNPGNVLRPGQFGRIRTVTERLPQAVVVPQRAIADVQGSFEVGVVRPDSTVELRQVTLGPRDGLDRVVLSGLQGGETIVVEGIQRMRNGVKVAPRASSATGDSAARGAAR